MILVAGILALTSSLLTALGMAELFQGLFIIFLVIDLGRFLVLNFVVDEWKNLRAVKWLITVILSLLFVYSAVGVYNKLNSMIPESVQVAMVEAASYNKAQDNAEIKQTRSTDLASVAQSEYQKSMDWNTKDYENCMKRANGDADAENKCNNTKRRLDRNASNALKEAMKTANADLDNTQVAVDKNVKNQGEIAGVLTTVCRILPNTDCKTYEGLQTALTVIILLVICGLDYLQLSIVLAVNTRKNKKEVKEEAEKPVEVEKIIEIPKEIIKKVRKPRKKKEKVVKEEPIIEEIISEPVQTEPEPIKKAPLKKVRKKDTPFTKETGFYK
ncbi:MAG: hypothetical protein J5691_00100 [Bacilli bacterium]|nr:hypothetical protein [Bacilli bacterium]